MGKPGQIFSGDEVKENLTLKADVCIVGSGSGGGWLARELTARGLDVVMLEEGGYHTRRGFDMTEATAIPKLYQEHGTRATDDLSITIFQGRSVGGGTTVNWCSTFRTPQRILDLWKSRFGVEGVTTEALAPHWDFIEKRLHVAEWPLELINANNKVLWDGLGKLGYDRGLIRRNVNGCANLGYCGNGCPLDAKQSMLVTTIPDAVEKGLQLYANASVRTLESKGERVVRAVADVLDPATDRPNGKKISVEAKTFALCGGAINSPALLLRSGLDQNGRVGQRTWLHPVVAMLAKFEQEIVPFNGAPQSVYSHHFNDRGPGKVGFILEVPPLQPMLASIASAGTGKQVQDLLRGLPHLNALLAITVDGVLPEETGATVKLRPGSYSRLSIDYDFKPAHWEAFRFACKEMAKLQFAAGAQQVMSLHADPVVLDSPSQIDAKLDAAPWGKLQHKVLTAHQMGGCPMGGDPKLSVVDSTLKFRGRDNLYVVDGSVLPTALGVNPQETIFGLSRWASQFVAGNVA